MRKDTLAQGALLFVLTAYGQETHFGRKSWLSVGAGSNILRTSSIRKRRLGSLFEHQSEEDKRRFRSALLLNATVHVGF